MNQQQKELIIELHENINRRIEGRFPDLFKTKIKEGKWYKSTLKYCEDFLVFITNADLQDRISYYGRVHRRGWVDQDYANNSHFIKSLVEASEEEVEDMLQKERVKRGLVEGAYYKSLIRNIHGGGTTISIVCKIGSKVNMVMYPQNKETSLLNNGNDAIFYNGQWAKVIENTITREEAEKQLGKKIVD